jgi:hypothetical protein
MTTIQIIPIDLHVAFATELAFQVTSVVLGKSANFQWYLNGPAGLLLQGNVTMDGEDYQNWNDDIPYVTRWICGKLNVEEKLIDPLSDSSELFEPSEPLTP